MGVSGNYFDTDEGPVTCLDTSCIYSPDQGNLSLFMINLSPIDKMSVTINLLGLEAAEVAGQILHHKDLKAVNTFEKQNAVVAKEFTYLSSASSSLAGELPPASLVRLDATVS